VKVKAKVNAKVNIKVKVKVKVKLNAKVNVKVKVKGHPITSHEDTQRKTRFSPPLYTPGARWGGWVCGYRHPTAISPRERPCRHCLAGWAGHRH